MAVVNNYSAGLSNRPTGRSAFTQVGNTPWNVMTGTVGSGIRANQNLGKLNRAGQVGQLRERVRQQGVRSSLAARETGRNQAVATQHEDITTAIQWSREDVDEYRNTLQKQLSDAQDALRRQKAEDVLAMRHYVSDTRTEGITGGLAQGGMALADVALGAIGSGGGRGAGLPDTGADVEANMGLHSLPGGEGDRFSVDAGGMLMDSTFSNPALRNSLMGGLGEGEAPDMNAARSEFGNVWRQNFTKVGPGKRFYFAGNAYKPAGYYKTDAADQRLNLSWGQ